MLFRRMPWLKSSHGSQISGIPVINSVAIANLFRRTLFDLMIKPLDLCPDDFTQTPTGRLAYHTLLSGGVLGKTTNGAGTWGKNPQSYQAILRIAPFLLWGFSYSADLWPSWVEISMAWPFNRQVPLWNDALLNDNPTVHIRYCSS